MSQRSTKIVATLGPASSDAEVLAKMFAAGVDVVRLNVSHGTALDHMKRAELVRDICRQNEDLVSMALFEELLADEEGHIDFLETQLDLLDKIGVQNYGQLQAEGADEVDG